MTDEQLLVLRRKAQRARQLAEEWVPAAARWEELGFPKLAEDRLEAAIEMGKTAAALEAQLLAETQTEREPQGILL